MLSMARRDDSNPTGGQPSEQAGSRCTSPADECPEGAIAGELASRPPAEAETPTGQAWRQERLRREEVRGTQQERKPAATAAPASAPVGREYFGSINHNDVLPPMAIGVLHNARPCPNTRADAARAMARGPPARHTGARPGVALGGCFRTANANQKFVGVERHVERRLRGLLLKRKTGRLKPGEMRSWTLAFFDHLGLIPLTGRIHSPESAHATL